MTIDQTKIALAEVFGYETTAAGLNVQNMYEEGGAEWHAFARGRANWWREFDARR